MTELNAAEIETPAAPATETVETPAKAAETEAKAPEAKPAPAAKTEEAPAPKGVQKPTIASGGAEAEAKEPEKEKPYWPEDWREKVAERVAGGDKKVYERELKRLQRVVDPSGIYGNYRELDNRLNGGGLVKVPSKDAKPEEIAEYHKAIGVPEKPEDYFQQIKLDNGAVIGEADKPIVDMFASTMHKAGATPAVMNAMLNTYYAHLEKQAADLDQQDDDYHRASVNELKNDWGSRYERLTNNISTLFRFHPRGKEGFQEMFGGRVDGKRFGDHPEIIRMFAALAQDVNPAGAVAEDGNQSGLSIDAELGAIRKRMREDRRGYDKDVAMQNRFRELITAQQKIQARA